MKLQHLAIIFVIIMLPISMVITYYIQTQIDTITLQTQYSSKLQTATHDAIKAFQLNTINNKYSTVSDSKVRDIEASISTFYNSLGTELGASGFNENELKEYVPAMVYTMQDGYYIYSKYYNDTIGDYQFGLRPYIYYSCRYKNKGNDFVVNYSLDNSITIYGVVGTEYVTKSGPLINPNLVKNIKRNADGDAISLEYDGVTIQKEILKEQLVLEDDLASSSKPVIYEYITYGNKRVYKDSKGYFWNTNNSKQYITDKATLDFAKKWTENGHLYSNSAIQYFVEGYNFSLWVNEKLSDITQKDAVDASGNQITDFAINTENSQIFKTSNNSNNPLLDDSVFNQNRISVIRKSIESNLSAAIANFGAGADYEFVMPIFTEDDWDKLVNNVSVSVFMQGIPIGAKYYNNYCIITNNKNKEHVSKESIYIITNDSNNNALTTSNEVHRASSRDVIDNRKTVIGAYKNVDFEKQTVVLENVTLSDGSNECYYHPHANDKCYECLVNVAETYNIDDIIIGKVKVYNLDTNTYIESNIDISNLRKVYLTALARERYDLNNIIGDNNDYTAGTEHIQKEKITITLNINTWTNQNVIATASTILPNAIIQTSKDGITWQNKASQTFESNGTMYARTIENGKQTNIATRYIGNIDKIAPKTPSVTLKTIDSKGKETSYASGTWTKLNVKITPSAIDEGGSGVSYYQYSTDGGKTAITMTYPFLISRNGEWNLLVRAVDAAGNSGPWSNPFRVLRDALEPSVPNVDYIRGTNQDKWQKAIEIRLTSESKGSPLHHYEVDYNNDGNKDITIGANGLFTPSNNTAKENNKCNVRFRAVNELGNASEWTNGYHIHVDNVAPSITTVNLNGYTSGTWTKNNVKITPKATDILGEIDYYEYKTKSNSNPIRVENPQSWIIKTDMEETFQVRARDKAGNVGPWSEEFTIKIQAKLNKPIVEFVSGENKCGWQNNIKIKVTTPGSKVPIQIYQIDGDNNGEPNMSIVGLGDYVPWNGYSSHTVRFKAVDVLGNTSEWSDPVHVHMDTEKPKSKHTERSPISVNENLVSIYFEATDNIKVKTVKFDVKTSGKSGTVDGVWDGKVEKYRLDINPNIYGTNTTYTIKITISDAAGNTTTGETTIKITGVKHTHTDGCYHKHTDSCKSTQNGGYCHCPSHNGSWQGARTLFLGTRCGI